MIPNDPFVDDALLEIAADIGLAPGLSPRSLARGFETVHEEFMKIYETADGDTSQLDLVRDTYSAAALQRRWEELRVIQLLAPHQFLFVPVPFTGAPTTSASAPAQGGESQSSSNSSSSAGAAAKVAPAPSSSASSTTKRASRRGKKQISMLNKDVHSVGTCGLGPSSAPLVSTGAEPLLLRGGSQSSSALSTTGSATSSSSCGPSSGVSSSSSSCGTTAVAGRPSVETGEATRGMLFDPTPSAVLGANADGSSAGQQTQTAGALRTKKKRKKKSSSTGESAAGGSGGAFSSHNTSRLSQEEESGDELLVDMTEVKSAITRALPRGKVIANESGKEHDLEAISSAVVEGAVGRASSRNLLSADSDGYTRRGEEESPETSPRVSSASEILLPQRPSYTGAQMSAKATKRTADAASRRQEEARALSIDNILLDEDDVGKSKDPYCSTPNNRTTSGASAQAKPSANSIETRTTERKSGSLVSTLREVSVTTVQPERRKTPGFISCSSDADEALRGGAVAARPKNSIASKSVSVLSVRSSAVESYRTALSGASSTGRTTAVGVDMKRISVAESLPSKDGRLSEQEIISCVSGSESGSGTSGTDRVAFAPTLKSGRPLGTAGASVASKNGTTTSSSSSFAASSSGSAANPASSSSASANGRSQLDPNSSFIGSLLAVSTVNKSATTAARNSATKPPCLPGASAPSSQGAAESINKSSSLSKSTTASGAISSGGSKSTVVGEFASGATTSSRKLSAPSSTTLSGGGGRISASSAAGRSNCSATSANAAKASHASSAEPLNPAARSSSTTASSSSTSVAGTGTGGQAQTSSSLLSSLGAPGAATACTPNRPTSGTTKLNTLNNCCSSGRDDVVMRSSTRTSGRDSSVLDRPSSSSEDEAPQLTSQTSRSNYLSAAGSARPKRGNFLLRGSGHTSMLNRAVEPLHNNATFLEVLARLTKEVETVASEEAWNELQDLEKEFMAKLAAHFTHEKGFGKTEVRAIYLLHNVLLLQADMYSRHSESSWEISRFNVHREAMGVRISYYNDLLKQIEEADGSASSAGVHAPQQLLTGESGGGAGASGSREQDLHLA